MTPERWQKIEQLYHSTLEREENQRAAFLCEVCAGDAALQREVESLLAQDRQADSFLESPAIDVAARAIAMHPSKSLIGRQLGAYKIVSLLGAGGMGEVYQAHDTKLGREVAIKVLPAAFVGDPERLARFQREARMLASLNHPNIATIHGLEHTDGVHYLVMELVPGQTLAERTNCGPLATEETLRIGSQIARALEAAHERGVIHRDLKPANVVVTPEGQVKVLDFGLAKRSAEEEVTRSRLSLTQSAAVIGTPAYMAPEQLRGEKADVRTDVWALGMLLYEMASGHSPFTGKTGYELTSSILREPSAPLPQHVPSGLRAIIQRCLSKEPGQRYQRAGEVRSALEAVGTDLQIAAPTAARPPRPRWLIAGAGMIVLLSLSVGLYELFRSKEPAVPSLQYFQLTNFADSVSSPALSPDGRMLAFKRGRDTFTGPGQIYVKLLPDGEPVEVTHDGLYKMSPVFSPDGSRIAYTGVDRWNWDTWIVPVLGGSPKRMLPNASGLTWIDSQHIMFSEIKPGIYMKVSTATESRAEERDIYRPPPVEVGMAHRSYLSPDRRSVLVAEMDTRGWLPCRRVPFDGSSLGERVGPSSAKCTEAAWSPDGSWMYFSADAGSGFHLWRQHSSGGAAEQLTFGITEEQGIAVAPDGRSLITAVGVEQSSVWLHDQRGDRQISSEGHAYELSVTPDGGKLYYLVRSGSSRAFVAGELWTADLASGRRERILPGFLVTRYDISADGNHIVFAANDSNVKSTVWLASLDRRVPPRLVSADAYRPYFDSHDEIFSLGREGTSAFIYRSSADGTGREKVIPDSVLYLLAVSPDGQWVVATKEGEANFQTIVAYQISSGTAKVICYDCTVTGPAYEGKSTISWAPNQKFLYFRSKLTGMAAPKTFVIPLQPGEALPKLPSSGIKSDRDLLVLPGSQMIEDKEMYFGPDPSVYAFVHTATQRNLYRLKLK